MQVSIVPGNLWTPKIEGYLVEQQRQRLLLGRVTFFKLCPRQEPCKRHHCILHVHNTAFLLVDMRSIYHKTLKIVQR
ncbi:hypothetical protein VFPPC_17679 [Pochonia chlamydosporia 170]|uniref:Uncharacterized protein n=1 Tax=Pochonia chlamydosporia 170 TaxID=1380566 RepID=A0A219ASF4_METCM|nr:hypothetical protein VFPPC_17679 [Pochonia chlamydosporia 170]OWT43145.1 hypothetical protein VFPPC_17679 [Pochonia chlamydosporia 170]